MLVTGRSDRSTDVPDAVFARWHQFTVAKLICVGVDLKIVLAAIYTLVNGLIELSTGVHDTVMLRLNLFTVQRYHARARVWELMFPNYRRSYTQTITWS
jgi:hypothetical protein